VNFAVSAIMFLAKKRLLKRLALHFDYLTPDLVMFIPETHIEHLFRYLRFIVVLLSLCRYLSCCTISSQCFQSTSSQCFDM